MLSEISILQWLPRMNRCNACQSLKREQLYLLLDGLMEVLIWLESAKSLVLGCHVSVPIISAIPTKVCESGWWPWGSSCSSLFYSFQDPLKVFSLSRQTYGVPCCTACSPAPCYVRQGSTELVALEGFWACTALYRGCISWQLLAFHSSGCFPDMWLQKCVGASLCTYHLCSAEGSLFQP